LEYLGLYNKPNAGVHPGRQQQQQQQKKKKKKEEKKEEEEVIYIMQKDICHVWKSSLPLFPKNLHIF
jgi:hypothetical protein